MPGGGCSSTGRRGCTEGRTKGMSYDLDANSRVPYGRPVAPADPRDLEVIVSLLEVAAIFLTEDPDSTFTEDELVARACALGGDEVPVAASDMRIVIRSARFLKKSGGHLRLR